MVLFSGLRFLLWQNTYFRLKGTAKEAKESGYYVRLFYVALDSAEESVERIANRVRNGEIRPVGQLRPAWLVELLSSQHVQDETD